MRKALIDLRPDEAVLGLVRASLFARLPAGVFVTAWILLPFFFFFPLLALGVFGLIFFSALVLSGFVRALTLWRNWYGTMLLITDERVIDLERTGIFKENRTEIAYNDLLDAVVEPRGFFEKIFGIGTVRIRTSKTLSYEVAFFGVRNPSHVADLINDVQYMTAAPSSASFHVAKKPKHQ